MEAEPGCDEHFSEERHRDTRFSVLRLTGHTEPGAIVNTHSGMSIV